MSYTAGTTLVDVELVHEGDPQALARSQILHDIRSEMEEERKARKRCVRLWEWLCCTRRKRERRLKQSHAVAAQLFE